MPVYVVSYDLTRPGQNYDTLWAELKRLGGQRVLQSQWAVNVNNTSAELRDHFWAYMDRTDRLLVMARDSGDWAGMNLMINLELFK
jgi:hypothetical protein